MKKVTLILAAIVMIASANTTNAQSTPVGTSSPTSVSTKIVTALTLTETHAMHFGTMARPTSNSVVLLTPAGTRSVESGAVELLTQAPFASVAAYDVTGDNDASYVINLPINVTLTSGANSMWVNQFTSSKALNASNLSSNGLDAFTVGASLNMSSGQPAGLYTGTFDVTVNYN